MRPTATATRRWRRWSIAVVVLVAAAGIVAGCGDGETDSVASDSVAPPMSAVDGTTDTQPPGTGSTDGGSTPDTAAPAPTPAPTAGQELDVVGVVQDDVLNFRAEPDPSAAILATAWPDVVEHPEDAVIVATGQAATHGSSTWWQVTVDGHEAWANSRYLGVLGASDDIPAELVGLEASGDEDLGTVLAQARPPDDAAGVDLYAVGVDAISSYFSIDVLGDYGGGVKGERFELEAANIKEFTDDTERVVGASIMGGTRTLICNLGVDDAGQCT